MEKVYIVCWGSGSCDDDGCAHAYSRVHGIYRTEESAKIALNLCKEEVLNDIKNDLDPDDEFPELMNDVHVYGSVNEGYFEIDYTIGTEPVEIYINLEAKDLLG
jgi:hypothetical protein